MAKYRIFNHLVESAIPLPQGTGIVTNEVADIFVEIGRPPKWVFDNISIGEDDYISDQIMWFYLKDLVIFYVEYGQRIVVHIIDKDISKTILQSYLTGSALCLALVQRNYIPIHGSSLVKNDRGVIISGRSGSGKSTISMGLVKKGLEFMSDDVSIVNTREGTTYVYPGFPQQKVCRDVIDVFDLKCEDLIYIDEDRDKFAHILRGGYYKKVLPVGCLIELIGTDKVDDVMWAKTLGANKLKQLTSNIYRGSIFQRMSHKEERMSDFLNIAKNIPMYQLIHPKRKDKISQVINCIENEILVEAGLS